MHGALGSKNECREKKPVNRVAYLDVLRAAACLAVVMLHIGAEYAVREPGSVDFWVGNLVDSISRMAVPLFVMISGALMLDENYALTKEKWKKHIRKLALFYLFWSIAYTVVFGILRIKFIYGKPVYAVNVILSIFNGYVHLWFIPMMIGLYLLLPLLRLWVKRENIRHVEYFLGLSAVFSFIIPHALALLAYVNPFVENVALFDKMDMADYFGYTAYFVLGWYLNNRKIEKTALWLMTAFAAASVTVVGTYAEQMLTGSGKFIFYDEFSVNVLAYSVAVFALCRAKLGGKQAADIPLHRAVSWIAENSMGIYAVHMAILYVLTSLCSSVPAILAVPVMFIACVLLSGVSAMILRRIPVLKKLV